MSENIESNTSTVNSLAAVTSTSTPAVVVAQQPEVSTEVSTTKVDCLVLDSAAFIKLVDLKKFASSFYTVQDVLNEVKDKNARSHLELVVLPGLQLKVRDPSPESVIAIIEFAKKTGDFHSLSATDIKVLALTHTLEREAFGTVDHLKTEPLRVKSNKTKPKDSEDTIVTPSQLENQANGTINTENSATTEEEETIVTRKVRAGNKKEIKELRDDEGWITPTNIHEVTSKLYGDCQAPTNNKVGCLTTDFSMQNVLLQMGLNLISVDGMRVRKLKQWILKCQGCNKITRDMSKVFCPHCGNSTLVRMPILVTESGEVIHLNYQPRVNLRGTKYSIPAPKGGKNAQNIILHEEDYLIAQRKQRKSSLDPFDPDFSFATSGASKKPEVVVGYGKKNPNVSRKKIGKNNKNKMNV